MTAKPVAVTQKSHACGWALTTEDMLFSVVEKLASLKAGYSKSQDTCSRDAKQVFQFIAEKISVTVELLCGTMVYVVANFASMLP